MQKYIKFIESLCMDKQLFFVIPSLYRDKEYEIHWCKGIKNPWSYRVVNGGDFYSTSSENIVAALAKEHLDMLQFENELYNVVCQQAVFADYVLDEARKVVGQAAIDSSVKSNDEFIGSIVGAINEVLNPASSPLRVIKDEET